MRTFVKVLAVLAAYGVFVGIAMLISPMIATYLILFGFVAGGAVAGWFLFHKLGMWELLLVILLLG